jgi:phage replication O-like protein O
MEGYTKLPNSLFDWLLAKSPELSKREIVIMLAVIRNTIGWNRERSQMSCRYIENQTGMAPGHVSSTLKQLEEKGLLIIDRSKQTAVISINPNAVTKLVTSQTEVLPDRSHECYQTGNGSVTKLVTEVLPDRSQINTERQYTEKNKSHLADWLTA